MSAFLPSFARRRGGPTSLTLIGGITSSTTSSLTIPSAAQAGDLSVFCQLAIAGSLLTVVTPTNYTAIPAGGLLFNGDGTRIACSYRVLDQAGAATLNGFNGSSNVKLHFLLRPDRPIKSVTAVEHNQEGTSAPAPVSLDFTGQKPPIFVFGAGVVNGTATMSGTFWSAGTNAHSVTSFKARYLISSTPLGALSMSMADGGAVNAHQMIGLIVA